MCIQQRPQDAGLPLSAGASFPQVTTHQENSKVIDLAIGLQHIIQFPESIEKIILRCTTSTDDPDALNVDLELQGFISEDTVAPSEASESEDMEDIMTPDHYNYEAISPIPNPPNHPAKANPSPTEKRGAALTRGAKRRERKKRQSGEYSSGYHKRSAANKARDGARRSRKRNAKVERNSVETIQVEESGWDAADLPASSTGWQGHRFSEWVGSFIKSRHQRPTRILDSCGRLVIYRSMAFPWLVDSMDDFIQEMKTFVADCTPFKDSDASQNVRGGHWFCIAGHDRQNKAAPAATQWQQLNAAAVAKAFAKGTLLYRTSEMVSRLTASEFPGIGERFLRCIAYMMDVYEITPLFGLYWNFCLNFWRENIPRVFCDPHVDKNNLACGGNSILERNAGWSSGRGVSLLSYLQEWFYYIEVVTTPDGEVPNAKNSHPLYNQWDEGEERGSCVWFNQATMFQSSELGIATMKKAREDGREVDIDFSEMVRSNKFLTFSRNGWIVGQSDFIYLTEHEACAKDGEMFEGQIVFWRKERATVEKGRGGGNGVNEASGWGWQGAFTFGGGAEITCGGTGWIATVSRVRVWSG
ncbi:hypothetical protein ARMGADRAFT_1026501 [Armillaria gallica]|uniref:Uncharacterized protein n=1 Tax=Armillaria gallica TaxID=47427 RepID=A0A2H3DTG1_ARMGA|nr:hypothetical protein ARMGADRAFT_1026501 [Armillaria gallica]